MEIFVKHLGLLGIPGVPAIVDGLLAGVFQNEVRPNGNSFEFIISVRPEFTTEGLPGPGGAQQAVVGQHRRLQGRVRQQPS